MVMEGVETTRMVHTYARQGSGKLKLTPAHKHPTAEELKAAGEQLRDIPRFLPFFVVVVVPLPGVTEGYALVAMTVERWLGYKFRLLPSRISDVLESAEHEKVQKKAAKTQEKG